MQLNSEQIVFVSIAASALVIALRFVYEFAKKKNLVVPDWVMLFLVYAASFSFAVLWFPQTLPALPVLAADPSAVGVLITYIGQLMVVLTAYSAAAAFIYDILLSKVKDGLGKAILPNLYNRG